MGNPDHAAKYVKDIVLYGAHTSSVTSQSMAGIFLRLQNEIMNSEWTAQSDFLFYGIARRIIQVPVGPPSSG